RQAGRDSCRFLLNSTIGLGGLFDPATPAGLEFNDEDFGQTFGKWGMKPGTYLEDDSTRYIIRGVSLLDMRAGLLDLDAQIDRAYDRYSFVRNAWLQRREFQVTDGEIEDP